MPDLAALRRRPTSDVLLATIVALPGLVALPWLVSGLHLSSGPAIVLLLVLVASVFARHRWPVGATAAGAIAYVVAVETGSIDPNGSRVVDGLAILATVFWLIVVSFTLGTVQPLWRSLAGLPFVLVAPQWDGFNPFPTVLVIGCWLVGWLIRSRQDIIASLDARGRELTSERERYAIEEVRYERARIARELHDVVAHCMSIIVVQAVAGQRLAASEPAAIEQLFVDIGELARQAESDLAGLTSLLSSEMASTQPLSQEGINRLVAHAGSAGSPVEVSITGDVTAIPALAAMALNRVLQEGLTNAVKHAPGAPIAVSLHTDRAATSLEIHNDAPFTVQLLVEQSGGNGVRGLRERVSALGGALRSEATPAGGWLLSAVLPGGHTDALPVLGELVGR